MQDHPVPQNVTAYEFRLVGNMTLKQFFELAAGGLLAFLTYSSNLPVIFKYPLALVFVLLGVALAFLPLEERPLDQWFLAFLRAIYNPTKFYWKKTIHVPDIFSFTRSTSAAQTTEPSPTAQKNRSAKIQAYFESIAPSAQPDEFEQALAAKISSLQQLYDTTPAAKNVAPGRGLAGVEEIEKPDLVVKIHNLHQQSDSGLRGTITIPDVAKKQHLVPTKTAPVKTTVKIVPDKTISIKQQAVQEAAAQPLPAPQLSDTQKYQSKQVAFRTEVTDTAAQVKMNITLPFPKTPTTPNIVVGMVLDANGKIVENAIIEIQKEDGFPVRALRTNRLGQFFSTTPLKTGQYRIQVEKEGFMFEPMSLSINDSILGPLEIHSH